MLRILALITLLILACCLLAASVAADRLILIPEGTTLTTGQVKGEYAARLSTGSKQALWANIGLSRLEVESAWFSESGAKNLNAISAQAAVLPETSFTPALAIGVRDIGNQTNAVDNLYGGRAFYLAASKAIPFTSNLPLLQEVKAHAGVGTGSLSGFFFGAETGVGKLHLAAEYDTSKFNYAATFNVLPIAKLQLSSMDGDIYYGGLLSTSF